MNDKLTGRLREVGRRFFRLRADNYGVVAVVTVILFPVLLGIAALALDVGRLQDLKRRQKNATIAAALSAGHELWQVHSDAAATAAAKEDAARNNFDEDDADRDITITVNIPPTSGNYAFVANHAEVFIEEQVSTYFAGVFGRDTVTVRSRAVTGLVKWGDACVIALEETRPHALVVAGNATLAAGCGIQVNSTNDSALFLAGQPLCLTSTTFIGVTGGIQGAGNSPCVTPEPVQSPPVLDPLDYLHSTAPYYDGTCDFMNVIINAGDDPVTLTPGTYCSGVVLGNYTDGDTNVTRVGWIPIPSIIITGGTVTFAPGVYTITGGMQITGGTVTGEDVTFFNTSTDPNRRNLWGEFDISGSPTVTLDAPSSGDYEGVLFWDDYRAPNRRPTHTFAGTATMDLGGALYFKQTNVTWAGTTDGAAWSMIIADTITVDGSAVIPGEGSFNDGDITPPTRKVTLLE